jgi:hypothetical protein
MTGNKTLIALSAAFALGLLGAASVAQANETNTGDEGGFVMPGSRDGVNPAYHRDLVGFRTTAHNAYAYAPIKHDRTSR